MKELIQKLSTGPFKNTFIQHFLYKLVLIYTTIIAHDKWRIKIFEEARDRPIPFKLAMAKLSDLFSQH